MTRDEVLSEIHDAYEATDAEKLLRVHGVVSALYTERDALTERLKAVEEENERLRDALEKIGDWDGNWGPFPEKNESWQAMAVMTARQAVPQRPVTALNATTGEGHE